YACLRISRGRVNQSSNIFFAKDRCEGEANMPEAQPQYPQPPPGRITLSRSQIAGVERCPRRYMYSYAVDYMDLTREDKWPFIKEKLLVENNALVGIVVDKTIELALRSYLEKRDKPFSRKVV